MTDHASRVLPALFAALRREGIRDVRAVTESHLVAFAAELARTKTARGTLPAAATRNAYLLSIRRFFLFLERGGVILRNPAMTLPIQKLDALPRQVLGERQAEVLMGAPSLTSLVGLRDRAILETLYGTAIRLSECGRLDVADLELAQGTLLVRNGKGKKDRVVPVPARAALALGRYLAEVRPDLVRDPKEPALFLRRFGGRLSTVMIALLVNAYGRNVGVKLSPHGLRHACATHLLSRGADIRHVQQLLGHRDIQVTARYTGVAIKDLHEVFARAHPREKKGRKRSRSR
jgi:integrase/recombinase XerD